MSTPSEQPAQDSAAGGVNSNLPKEGEKPSGEQYPDPATHADDPAVRDATLPPAPPPTQPASNPPA